MAEFRQRHQVEQGQSIGPLVPVHSTGLGFKYSPLACASSAISISGAAKHVNSHERSAVSALSCRG